MAKNKLTERTSDFFTTLKRIPDIVFIEQLRITDYGVVLPVIRIEYTSQYVAFAFRFINIQRLAISALPLIKVLILHNVSPLSPLLSPPHMLTSFKLQLLFSLVTFAGFTICESFHKSSPSPQPYVNLMKLGPALVPISSIDFSATISLQVCIHSYLYYADQMLFVHTCHLLILLI